MELGIVVTIHDSERLGNREWKTSSILGDDDRGDSLCQGADGSRWVDTQGRRDDGGIADVEVFVAEDFAAVVDDTVGRGLAHVAAAERVRGDELLEDRPGRRHQRKAAGGLAQLFVHCHDGIDQGAVAADVPVEGQLAAGENARGS